MKKVLSVALVLVSLAIIFCSCGRKSPEIGEWRGTIQLSKELFGQNNDLFETCSFAITGGNGIDLIVKFNKDGTYEMKFDGENLKKAIKESINSSASIVGVFFGVDLDVSGITDNIIELVVKKLTESAGAEIKTSGTYVKKDDLIVCNDDGVPIFNLEDDTLIMLGKDNSTELTLYRNDKDKK